MIPIQSDTIDEDDETFQAVLSQNPVTSTVTIDPAMAVVTITDDDGKNNTYLNDEINALYPKQE